MLTSCEEVFAKMEGSPEVSKEILTHTPGTRDRIKMVRRNKLYEFGYSTDIYLAHMDEYIYTKITTISPLFIVANYTQNTVLFA